MRAMMTQRRIAGCWLVGRNSMPGAFCVEVPIVSPKLWDYVIKMSRPIATSGDKVSGSGSVSYGDEQSRAHVPRYLPDGAEPRQPPILLRGLTGSPRTVELDVLQTVFGAGGISRWSSCGDHCFSRERAPATTSRASISTWREGCYGGRGCVSYGRPANNAEEY